MKLVDILARELKVWPEDDGGHYYCVQHYNSRDVVFGRGNTLKVSEIADDNHDAEVTHTQWQAAVDALKAENCAHLWVGWSDTEACELCNATRKVVVEWNGEGLPPVGTVCEWKEKTGFQWVAATILFITASSVVCQRADGFEWQMLTKRTVFRPIRTPEQIAAEARQRSIDEMVEANIAGGLAPWVCAEIYDAGYRKF